MRTGLDCYWKATIRTSASFRVGRLAAFLEKACALAQPAVTSGEGEVAFRNNETGEGATVTCRRGAFAVVPDVRGRAYDLDTRALSEVCFGVCPIDLLLPDLPEDAPIRRVLPVRACVPHLFAV